MLENLALVGSWSQVSTALPCPNLYPTLGKK